MQAGKRVAGLWGPTPWNAGTGGSARPLSVPGQRGLFSPVTLAKRPAVLHHHVESMMKGPDTPRTAVPADRRDPLPFELSTIFVNSPH